MFFQRLLVALFVLAIGGNWTAVGQDKAELRVFRTVKLGTEKGGKDFAKDIEGKRMKVSMAAGDLLANLGFRITPKEMELDLVAITGKELGFEEPTEFQNIVVKAKEMGLQLCPAQVGPELRLQYDDQPPGPWLVIGMEPMNDSKGSPKLFGLGWNDNGLHLETYGAAARSPFPIDHKIVFVQPRK